MAPSGVRSAKRFSSPNRTCTFQRYGSLFKFGPCHGNAMPVRRDGIAVFNAEDVWIFLRITPAECALGFEISRCSAFPTGSPRSFRPNTSQVFALPGSGTLTHFRIKGLMGDRYLCPSQASISRTRHGRLPRMTPSSPIILISRATVLRCRSLLAATAARPSAPHRLGSH